MFIDIFLLTIDAIEQTPFVSSISPVKIPFTYLEERPKIFKIGERKLVTKSNEPLLFKIEITTEKSTTNPPIRNIVLIAFIIEVAKTSPKLDKHILEGRVFKEVSEKELLFLHFHHLNKKPTVMHART